MYDAGLTMWLACIALTLLGLLVVTLVSARERCLVQGITAFAVQVVLGISLLALLGLVADDVTYHSAAADQAQSWHAGGPSGVLLPESKQSIALIIGVLYYLFGPNPILGLILNAILMGLVPAMLAYSCRNFDLKTAASSAAWLAALAPQFLLWSPWLRREALSFFLLTGVVVALSLIFRNRNPAGITLLVAVTLLLAVTRGQLVSVAVFGGVAALLLSRIDSKHVGGFFVLRGRGGALGFAAAGILVLVISQYSYFRGFISDNLDYVIARNSSPSENLRVESASAESNSTLPGVMWNVLRSMWGPFPWEWQNLAWVFAGLDGLIFLAVTICAVIVLRRNKPTRKQVCILLISIVPLVLGTALSLANYGIAMRVRAHCLPFLIPVVAVFLAGRTTSLPRSVAAKIKALR